MILIEAYTRRGKLRAYNTEGTLVAHECIKCDELLPLCDFNRKKEGHHTVCKDCNRAYKKEYHKTDRCKQISKISRDKRKDKFRVYYKEWKSLNPKRVSELQGQYYDRHKQRINERTRVWVSNNKERRAEITRNSSKKHKDKKNAYKREYRKLKPEIRTDHRLDRRLGHVQYFIKEINKIRLEIRKLNQGRPASEHLTMDHIIPLVHKDVCGLNSPANIQLLTRSQNAFKNNRWDGTADNTSWIEEYKKTHGEI